MPSGCASGSRSSPRARSRSKAAVDEARGRLRPIVRLRTRAERRTVALGDPRRRPRARATNGVFELPESGPEPLLKALIDGGAGIETLAIERPGLHDAFVAIAGESAAAAMGAGGSRAMMRFFRSRLRHRPPRFRARRSCRRPSCSSCSARCSRCCSAGVFGGIGARVASRDRAAGRGGDRVRRPISIALEPRATGSPQAIGDERVVQLVGYSPEARSRRSAEAAACEPAIRRSARS